MNQKASEQFKKDLEEEKTILEEQLKTFTKKDPHLKGDYDTEFPDLGIHQSTDEMAQEVSLYESSLPMEHALELKLQDIGLALEKIEQGKYGICENCHKKIDIKRLETKPEAKYCVACKAKSSKK